MGIINNIFKDRATTYGTITNLKIDSSAGGTIPGLEIVGCTCNPFGVYLGAIKQIFDYDKSEKWNEVIGYKAPQEVTVISGQQNSQRDTQGATMEEYQESLTVHTKVEGNTLCWSGSAEVDCNKASSRTSSRSYCTVRNNISLWTLKLAASKGRLRGMLLEDFKSELDALTPGDSLGPREREAISRFFDKYGSHFINGVRMGGCAYMTSSIESSYCTGDFDLHAEARVAYNGLVNKGSAEASADYSTHQKTFQSHAERECITVGGDATKGGAQAFDSKTGYARWEATIKQSPDLIDFLDDQSLTPIWDLCVNEEKGKLLEEHFLNYWSENASYLTALDVVLATSLGQQIDSHFRKVSPEITSNPAFGKAWSKNDWKYTLLCGAFKKPNCDPGKSEKCVTDIIVVGEKDSKPDVPTGYTLVNRDFSSALEKARYICYKTEPYDPAKAVRRLKIVKQKGAQAPHNYSGPVELGGEVNWSATVDISIAGKTNTMVKDGHYESQQQTADLYFGVRPDRDA